MVMSDTYIRGSKSLFGSGFLPATFQGTLVNMQGRPLKISFPRRRWTRRASAWFWIN